MRTQLNNKELISKRHHPLYTFVALSTVCRLGALGLSRIGRTLRTLRYCPYAGVSRLRLNTFMKPLQSLGLISGWFVLVLSMVSCTVTDRVNQALEKHQARSIAAQHRIPAPHQTVGILQDPFLVQRQNNIGLKTTSKIALGFEPLPDALHQLEPAQYPSSLDQVALNDVVDRAYRRHFTHVFAMSPQSYDSAMIEAKHRSYDYLSFMRVTGWSNRELAKSLGCQSKEQKEAESNSDPEVKRKAEEARLIKEREEMLSMAGPSSPRGLRLPDKVTLCSFYLSYPRDRVEIRFWLVHLASGEVIDQGRIYSTSGWLGFMGDQPSTLLVKPIEKLVASYLDGVR